MTTTQSRPPSPARPPADRSPASADYAMCIEQTLGHRAHGLNLHRAMEQRGSSVDYLAIRPPERPRVRMPWALRGSIGAFRAVRAQERYRSVFFHTQTVSLLAPAATRGAPYVVSLDATPVQVDTMGRWYGQRPGTPLAERVKRAWYRQVLKRASAVVTWSEWAMESVREDYRVTPKRTLIVHPGAGADFFAIPRSDTPRSRPSILFVGGQFHRKGGLDLLEAFEPLRDRADLVIVTEDEVAVPEGVTVLRNIRPGTPEQRAVFAEADIFCLPTYADCTPVAIGEAMAAGLPVVSTTVGSNYESVPRDAGVLVTPGDVPALRAALEALVDSPERRAAFARRARQHAQCHMDAEKNAGRILDLLEEVGQ